MTDTAADARRTRQLNDASPNPKGGYVLYWMQQSQRVHGNHALDLAIEQADTLRLPVVVVFGLTSAYPEANWRHFAFMLQGLAEVDQELARMGVVMHIAAGSPPDVALAAGRDAALIVCDRGYLRHQRGWRADLAARSAYRVVEVESDAIVPVELASDKADFAARTFRPKINRLLPQFMKPIGPGKPPRKSSLDLFDRTDVSRLADRLDVDRSVRPATPLLDGGYSNALIFLDNFIEVNLSRYTDRRYKVENQAASQLSPYLHFGQISALQVALSVQKADAPEETKAAFLEELIVRRELAINHVWFNPHYDAYEGLPAWARRTLADHASDARRPIYDDETLEAAQTQDPYWNACMQEMRATGTMPGYLRMYWGKKILQWQPTPQQAFATALRLNNKYFLDGRDPNSYAGVGWVFGLHDRPWQERPIYGQIRYMARSGLERKFDMGRYIDGAMRRIAKVS
ncbi:deoxyribodipyrimidine photo-lyase [Desulfatitalea tepidiphila]|uniref:deoxyribodipyrimidine photo-lyase n=1 Tax=Desulfatitalea tepidiphila TaxID=1185843 RepID=UPI0006B49003|nr:deoxyribodipyrimidine photo-lyase [Desulfatitalea tepidiphila]